MALFSFVGRRFMVTKKRAALFEGNGEAPPAQRTNSLKVKLDDMSTIQPKSDTQRDFFEAYARGHYFMCLHGVAGTGKALKHGEKVLTPQGFVNIENIKVGDKVTTPNNTVETVTGVYPQGAVDTYKVTFQDGSSVHCCGEHLWKFHIARRAKKDYVNTTKEMIERMKQGQRLLVPLVDPLDIIKENYPLPIKPYTLGALIGDGSISTPSIAIVAKEKEIIDNITNDGYEVRPRSFSRVPSYGVLGIADKLKELDLVGCLSETKFVPSVYKTASVEDRFSLLQGIFDTDGYIEKNGNVTYTSVSKQLIEDVQYILRSLGFTATLSSRVPSYTHKGEKRKGQVAYTLYVRGNNKANLFRLERKKERVKTRHKVSNRVVSIELAEKSEATCISISGNDNLFVTTNFVVTHNTYIALYKALEDVLDRSTPFGKVVVVRSAVQSREMGYLPGGVDEKMEVYIQPYRQITTDLFARKDAWDRLCEQGHVEFLSTSFIRGTTFSNSIILVDEFQNCNFEELDTVITRVGHTSKIIFCGDVRQTDLKKKDDKSGLNKFLNIAGAMKQFSKFEFTVDDICRSSLVKDYIVAKMQYEDGEQQ